MNAAAFQATYSDFKLVRGRKVVQIVLELPIEQSSHALECLGGMPNPASEVWVACARLNKESEVVSDQADSVRQRPQHKTPPVSAPERPARAPRPFTSLPLPQQAALLCQDPVFIAFLDENFATEEAVRDPADLVRNICGVISRRHLKPDLAGGKQFIRLREQFFAWKQVAA